MYPRSVTRLLVVIGALSAFAAVSLDPGSADAQRRRRQRPQPRGDTGNLVIDTTSEGAEIYVDAELVGTAPLAPMQLPPGTYTVRVARPGYTEFTDVVTIRAGEDTRIEADLMAVSMVLHVSTEPEGGRVFLDGRFAGTTPVDVEVLDGTHSIRVTRQGYRDAVREITGRAGRTEDLHLDLERLSEEELREQGLAPPEPPEWYEKPMTWLLVGGGALAVALGVVLVVVVTSDEPSQLDTFCRDSCTLVRPPFWQ